MLVKTDLVHITVETVANFGPFGLHHVHVAIEDEVNQTIDDLKMVAVAVHCDGYFRVSDQEGVRVTSNVGVEPLVLDGVPTVAAGIIHLGIIV